MADVQHSALTGAELHDPKAHASGHITSGSDEIDGDKLDIDWSPSNYTPSTTPSEADSVDNLTAHLYGIDQALAGAGGSSSTLIITGTAGENLSEDDVVYLATDSSWYKVNCTSTPPQVSLIRGIVAESGGITSSSTGDIQIAGLCNQFTSLSAGSPVWVDPSTEGGVTQTEPAPTDGGGQVAIVPVGIAQTTTAILLNCQSAITIAMLEMLDDDETMTVQHPSDALYIRGISAVNVVWNDLATTGQITTTGSWSSSPYDPPNAFDNDTGSLAQGTGGATLSIGQDFGVGITYEILRVRAYRDSTGSYGFNHKLQYSDDAAAWYDAGLTINKTQDNVWTSHDVSGSPGAHRYWRLLWVSGSVSQINELEFIDLDEVNREPLIIGSWSQEDQLVVARFGDSSGNNPTTKVTFANRSGGQLAVQGQVRIG